jgi:hypothetical protein
MIWKALKVLSLHFQAVKKFCQCPLSRNFNYSFVPHSFLRAHLERWGGWWFDGHIILKKLLSFQKSLYRYWVENEKKITMSMNRTSFTIVKDEEQVDTVVAASKKVVGELDEHETVLLLVLPVTRAYGMTKKKKTK